MKRFSLSVLVFLFFLFFAPHSFASAPQIIASPSGTINLNESFTLSATMSGLSKSSIYRLRVAIAQPGMTDYFGSTFDGTSWHTGSISSGNYISITTDGSGAWSGNIQGKIDPEDPNFTTGSGTYDLKVGRYTQTGSTATWSDPVPITIFVPSPTPVPSTPTPTSPPTIRPPMPTQTKVPTILITPKKSIPTFSASPSGEDIDILGTESADLFSTPTPTILIAGSEQRNSSIIFLLLGSIIVLAAGGISGWMIYVRNKGRDIFYRQL